MRTVVGDSLNKPTAGFLGVNCERTQKTLSPGLTNSQHNELFSGSLQRRQKQTAWPQTSGSPPFLYRCSWKSSASAAFWEKLPPTNTILIVGEYNFVNFKCSCDSWRICRIIWIYHYIIHAHVDGCYSIQNLVCICSKVLCIFHIDFI